MNEKQIEPRVATLDCEHDAAAIKRGLQGFPGIHTLKVYPQAAKVRITYDPSVTHPEGLKEKLGILGFPVRKGMEIARPPKPWRNPKVLTSVVSGVLLLVGWLVGLVGTPAVIGARYSPAVFVIGMLIAVIPPSDGN